MRTLELTCLVAAFAMVGLATACDDPQSPKPTADLLPTGSTLAAAVTTTGSSLDPDGYEVWVDNSFSQSPPDNGVAYFNGLSAGDHRVALEMVSANCLVTGTLGVTKPYNPRTVSIMAGVNGSTRFDVGCASVGSLYIATTTTGADLDPDGYTISVDGASQPVATNGNVTFTGLATGSHTVAISGAAANCTLGGANGQTANVLAGGMTDVSYTLSCAPTGSGTGSVTVTTNTSGANLPLNGYTVTIDGTFSQPIATNGSVTFTGPAGAHPLALSGVAANCDVSGANPVTVAVPSGASVTTTFAVTCSAVAPLAVSGHAQLGWGSATPGNAVEVFDFAVRQDGTSGAITGRFRGIDYGDIHPSGLPGSLTTDPVNDPQTSFVAYRNTSPSECKTASHGVEFDAIGRGDEGDLRFYTVQVCDDGPAGSGVDFFSIYIPGGDGYGKSGVLTSGDIVKK
ncbi:MAG TPA: hypothetical protein VM716_03895 [Gemmatimonadales bacterium]|nr:hypothetical protein [Gemmatimonadales bacterium]